MEREKLNAQFTKDFIDEFQYDSEFVSIFEAISRGLTPYEAIEHLCKAKKEIYAQLAKAVLNAPTKIIVTTERMEEIKNGKS